MATEQHLQIISEVMGEADALLRKHGPMPSTPEAIFAHTHRASRRADCCFIDKVSDRLVVRERLIHAAAVYIRAVEALDAAGD